MCNEGAPLCWRPMSRSQLHRSRRRRRTFIAGWKAAWGGPPPPRPPGLEAELEMGEAGALVGKATPPAAPSMQPLPPAADPRPAPLPATTAKQATTQAVDPPAPPALQPDPAATPPAVAKAAAPAQQLSKPPPLPETQAAGRLPAALPAAPAQQPSTAAPLPATKAAEGPLVVLPAGRREPEAKPAGRRSWLAGRKMAKERLRLLRWGWREKARSAWHGKSATVNPLDLVLDIVEGLSAEHEWVDVLQVASKARCRGLAGGLDVLEMWEVWVSFASARTEERFGLRSQSSTSEEAACISFLRRKVFLKGRLDQCSHA